jgi:mono/diheme cytochrome c family protein
MKSLLITLFIIANVAFTQDFNLDESVKRGKAVYMQTCFACHQMTGQGVPGAFPPLAGTPYVNENPRRLVAITLKGITGPLTVLDKTYNAAMVPPETTFPILKDDAKMADVLNYVRNSFGNKATEAVTPAFVTEVRKEFADRTAPWTEAELKAFPAKSDAAPAATTAPAATPATGEAKPAEQK